jgi:MFS family permease
MVIMTVGELLLMPTATSYTANLAPVDMRGRYMSIFSLTWGIAQGIGPVAGGYLSDNFGIATPWFGGGVVGLFALTAFLLLERKKQVLKPNYTD